MALRLLAFADPVKSDEAGSELLPLLNIDDILAAAGCGKAVADEIGANTWLLEQLPKPTRQECLEALQWVFDSTKEPRLVLRALTLRNTQFYLCELQHHEETPRYSLLDNLDYLVEDCRSQSVLQRLDIAMTAAELAKRSEKWTSHDLLFFIADLLNEIRFEKDCPADHRRNLLVAAVECRLSEMCEIRGRLGFNRVKMKDILFGLSEMKRLISNG